MRARRIIVIVAVLAIATVGAALLGARSGILSVSRDEVTAQYQRPDSRFVTIDGVRFHYVDEGQGPAIVLLHGSYLDLNVWDGWASALRGSHRVIRVDRTPFGLTGLDPRNAYSYPREAELLRGFVDHLKLDRFALVGTSSAGTTATRFAANNPDRLDWLVLVNFPLARRFIRPVPSYARMLWVRDKLLLNYQPSWSTRRTLTENLADDGEASEAMVARLTAEANQTGVMRARRTFEKNANAYGEAQRRADLAVLRTPVLLMWGAQNPLLTLESGRDAFAAVGSPHKRMTVLPGASHMIPVEKSAEALEKVMAFKTSLPAAPSKLRPEEGLAGGRPQSGAPSI